MRVLVTGGRSFGVVPRGCPDDPNHEHRVRAAREALLVTETLDTFLVDHGITALIHGAVSGVDTIAAQWATRRLIEVLLFRAPWGDLNRPGAVIKRDRRGRPYDAAAGPFRNGRMLREGNPDVVLAFPGGDGTADMCQQAEAAGVRVIRIAS